MNTEHQSNRKGKDFFKVLFSFLSFCFFFVSVSVMMVTIATGFANIKVMYVVSDSMSPTLNKGDAIFVSTQPNTVAVGDVVAYRAEWLDNSMVTHRVVEKDGGNITTKGDSNVNPDPVFDESKIFGEVLGTFPKGGILFNTVSIWVGVIAGFVFSIISDLLRYKPKRPLKKSIFSRKTSMESHHYGSIEESLEEDSKQLQKDRHGELKKACVKAENETFEAESEKDA